MTTGRINQVTISKTLPKNEAEKHLKHSEYHLFCTSYNSHMRVKVPELKAHAGQITTRPKRKRR